MHTLPRAASLKDLMIYGWAQLCKNTRARRARPRALTSRRASRARPPGRGETGRRRAAPRRKHIGRLRGTTAYMADDAAARISAALSPEADPSARQEALAELAALGAADAALAAQCVAPLVDLQADTTDANEHQQASVVLAGMLLLDPLQLAAAWMKTWTKTWTVPNNAFARVLAREPAALTRDDLLTLAASLNCEAILWGKGLTAMAAAAGLDNEMEHFGQLMGACPFSYALAPAPLPDELLGAVFTLALSVCRDPDGLSELQMAGVWFLICMILIGRPSMAGVAASAGLAEVAMSSLRATEPCDMIRCDTPAGIKCGVIALDLFHLSSQLNGLAGWEWPLKLLIDSGLGGVLTSFLKVSTVQLNCTTVYRTST
jgi:hypothetical protein